MTVNFELGWLINAALLSVRVAAATTLTAVLGPTELPGLVRVLVALSLGVLLASSAGAAAAPVASIVAFVIACLGELIIGAAMAAGFLAAYSATQVAGRVLDTQMGFGIASIFNPATRAAAPLLGTLLGMAGVSIFLAMDGHHVLIRALAQSVESLPPGSVLLTLDWEALTVQSGVMFGYGLALAAPVMSVLLLTDLALAVFARSMPQLNIFVMGFAVKILLGLVALAAAARLTEPVFSALFRSTFAYWQRHAAGG
jgi:flagellar biosynthetic protein FliR